MAVLKKHKLVVFTVVFLAIILFVWKFVSTFSVDTSDSSWDGTVALSFTSGTGTEENPYIISNASEYAYFKELLEGQDAFLYLDKHYVITKSINYGNNDISINNSLPFTGTLDGNGTTIYNIKIKTSLFESIDGATISNIKFGAIDIVPNKSFGVVSNNINNSRLSYIILEGTTINSDDIPNSNIVYGIGSNINNSSIDNVVINIKSTDNFISITNNIKDTNIENVIVRSGYSHLPENAKYTLNEFSYVNDKIVVDDIDKYENDNYKILIDNNEFIIKSKKSALSFEDSHDNYADNTNVKNTRSSEISVHDSGVVPSEHSVYINDLTSDYNYYMGLNYTKITNTTGAIPTGVNQNLYSDSNLATVYIRYSSADINNPDMYGSVSVAEDIRNFYYYKRVPIINGYISFDLIDNPWANRPIGMGFNGWVTDYDGANISLDMDTYVRNVTIPVSDVNNPISITFYSSWTTASVVTTTTFTNLKNVGMNEIPSSYGDLTIYYVSTRINYNSYYPNNNDLYDLNGNHITSGSRCRTSGGCTYLTKNTNNNYNSSTSYYTVTPNGVNPATVTRVYPQARPISYYTGGTAAGYFIKVTSGTENIYSSTGTKLDSCNGTCYKLLQYNDGNITNGTTYYYLTTRDTNIFAPASTTNITVNNINSAKPMTITGINEGVDNSNNRTLRITDDWTISADIRVEFIRFYVNDTTTSVDEFDGDGYEIIGNFKNVKLGRGLKRNGSNLTANGFVGGSSSSATSLTKYSLIVESGFYQNGSAVGYDSATTHRVISNVTLGSDFDRVSNNGNSNLIVYYCYAGSWGSNLYNSSSNSSTYDKPAIYTVVKSGSFGLNKADYAAGIYAGGRASGTHYALREVLVEGGYIYNLIGGPSSDNNRASKNDIIINVKGGEIDLVFGGAGASDTVGNKILNITGGTINYSIVGGSNASEYSSNTSNPNGKIDGDTLLYVGGNVTVGTKTDKLFTIESGDVYGAGNGREGESTVGAVNNSNIIIGASATINGNIYGGGNNGAVGGNTTGSTSGSGSQIAISGVYEDTTQDNSIRYYGSNPNNYIQFNGELYRIVGLFNNINSSTGSKSLVRIVKASSLGNRTWGNTNMSSVETNTSTETSGGIFSSTYNYTNYYKNYYNYFVKSDNTKSNLYDYLNTTYYDNLDSTYKNYIEDVNWNLGASSNINQNANALYVAERGNAVVNYLSGVNQTSNGSSSSSYMFKVGLLYPSDYGFANNDNSCLNSDLSSYSTNCRSNNWMSSMTNAWTLIPSTDVTSVMRTYQVGRTGSIFNYTYTMNRYYHVSNRSIVFGTSGIELKDIYYTNNDNDAENYYNMGAVYPSFYLKENITISGGSGKASDPYIIGNSGETLIDIINNIMHPSDPEVPPVIVHDESEYIANTKIKILGGTISGSVYGAGNKNGTGNNNGNKLALAKVDISMTGGVVSESIYGGANAEGTVYGDVFIDIIDGTVSGNVYGGGKGGYSNESEGTFVTDNVNISIGSNDTSSLHINGNVYGGSAFGTVNAGSNNAIDSNYATNVIINSGIIAGSVYGGGEGNENYTPKVIGNIYTTINGGDITNVFGGNDQAGIHSKYNIVQLNGGTIGSVYGGGNKSSVINTHVYLDGSNVTNLYGGANISGEVNTTDVKIRSGNVGNVYGGNNQGGTCTTSSVLVQGTASVLSSIYGGGNQVDTTTTNVSLNSCNGTIPNVYGGGNAASVTTSNVTQNGINATNIYGGSNSSGTVLQSNVIVNSGVTQNVYGGNNAGGNSVTTNISINGGNITQVYGGGNQANSGTSNIIFNAGLASKVYGGGNNAGVDTTNVTINNAEINEVYGGSNNSGDVSLVHITLNDGEIGSIYGGGNLAKVTNNTYVDINGGNILGNIYGGGNQGIVKGSSFVTITDANVSGSVYAGGNGLTATLEGNTNISIDGATVIGTQNGNVPATGCVFGGGNQAYTGIETNNSSVSTVNIAGGTIYGNVYGGANTSVVYGNTLVNIGASALRNELNLIKDDLHIYGHVFGGGEANASGSEIYDWYFISVTQGTHIDIDAIDYTNFLIDGSFYGGGNASSASGDSYLNISNYGSIGNPKRNVSIQRVTYAVIDNSCILLKGAIDRANDYDKELFAVSRVDDFTIKNNTELYFETGANLLKKFRSLDNDNSPAVVTIDEDANTYTRTVNNRVYMYEGKNLNIAKDQQVTDYGEVIGMSFLGIFNYGNNGSINTGMYSNNHMPGDTLDWAEAFSRGSYVLGLHEVNHNIQINGFYSYFMNEDTMLNEIKYIRPTPESARFYMWFIGENVIEYNVNLVASKYSTLGSVETSFLEFSKPNTTFTITHFDCVDLANGINLLFKDNIPRIAQTEQDANSNFGLSIESSNSGWLTPGSTQFSSSYYNAFDGQTSYEKDSTNAVPTLLFYLHHSKNITVEEDLGTVRISMLAVTKIDALKNEIKRLVINVNMSTALFQTNEYEGAMSPGDKYELFASTATNITSKSKFSAFYGLYGSETNLYKLGYHRALSSSFVLPVGTKITMMELSDGDNNYYYHVIDNAEYNQTLNEYNNEGECSYLLSEFVPMGSKGGTVYYDDAQKNTEYYDGLDSNEEFIFIVDFEDANITTDKLGNTLLLEIRDSNEESIITVLGIQHSQMTYNLYANKDAEIDVNATIEDNPLYVGYRDITDLSVSYQSTTQNGLAITDTLNFDKKLGAQIHFLDRNGHIVSGTDLVGTTIINNGQNVSADIKGYYRFTLSQAVGNVQKWLFIDATYSLLPTGDYTMVIEVFPSIDGIYYEKVIPSKCEVDFSFISTSYGLKPVLAEDSVVFKKEKENKLSFTVDYFSLLDNPNIRLTMYRRKYDDIYDTDYEEVDLQDYIIDDLTASTNINEYILFDNPDATNQLSLNMKTNLLTGTYRLAFKLYDNDIMVGEIYKYIVVR